MYNKKSEKGKVFLIFQIILASSKRNLILLAFGQNLWSKLWLKTAVRISRSYGLESGK